MPAETTPVPDPAARNIEAVAAIERAARRERSGLDRLTDAVTHAAGSPAFIVGHVVWFAAWIAVNVTGEASFDPYPFSLLMLVVALEAIFLSTVVLMTQNRMQHQADRRAHLDLQINMLAEQELTAILQMLTAISQRMGVETAPTDGLVEQLTRETDIHTISAALDRELTDTSNAPSSEPEPHTPSPHRS